MEYVQSKNDIMVALERDVYLLKDSMDIIQALVCEQQDAIDTIEDAIRTTREEVVVAETALIIAEKHNTGNWYYVSGFAGFIGFVVGVLILF